tara:strand:- start:146 stop:562 length:417 start_codon:yes stop_codon:yes gene_type:complete
MNNSKSNKKFDIDALSQKLESLDSKLKQENNSFKELVLNISEKDDTNVTKATLYSLLDEDKKHYFLINEEYKALISNFSQAYIEMSEWYCGPEIPFEVYQKIYKKKYYGTYLDSKEDVKELYKLFAFMFLFESYMTRL